MEAATSLSALADRDTGQVISSVAEALRKQACRIAFVGQVKAGKSSLINILVEQPGLLPADINPCTAVITRLSFGVLDKPRGWRLVHFLQPRRMAPPLNGRTHARAYRPAVPGLRLGGPEKPSDSDGGEGQRKSWGPPSKISWERSMCTRRFSPTCSSSYVGTEYSHAESEAERAEGEFSDITKSADIFLDLGAFSFPTVLIDTPGVNDPFLVRDEITRQNLELADICVVVVTAWQRLSATDLNLLRMLRGLKKDRLIIFINKVDELKGGEEVLNEIGRQVSATLEQEFPSARIPARLRQRRFCAESDKPR